MTEERRQRPAQVMIAVPTCGDLDALARLLVRVAKQADDVRERVRVLVVDNAPCAATERLVTRVADDTGLSVRYQAEPESGIPFARNAAVRTALDEGVDALIFVDDDEWPAPGWLPALLCNWQTTGADVVLGPAHAILPSSAPRWAHASGVFDKDRGLATGTPIRTAYTYNTLIDARVLADLGPAFHPAFRHTGGSDRHFFKEVAGRGFRSVWCAEALVHEEVGADRAHLGWVLRRGFRTGACVAVDQRLRHPRHGALVRRLLLGVANVVYGVVLLLDGLRPGRSPVTGLRRWAIAAGLFVGNVLGYEEYAPQEAG